ncbi:hypothetical protein PDL05_22075 [Bacillus cereus group sp. BY112LC]|nr:hypothetical protein [Bacillus cereus group sp. BY112LC]
MHESRPQYNVLLDDYEPRYDVFPDALVEEHRNKNTSCHES